MLFTRKKTDQLSPAEAAESVHDGKLVLVDVREHDERAEGSPAGSRHIPLGALSARIGELPADRPVAFICRTGRRSAMASRAAARRGIDAANVHGGMVAWASAGLPVETRRGHR